MRTEYGLLLPKIVSECCELVEVMSLIVRSNFWYTVYVPLFLSATFCPTLSNPVRWQNWMAAFLGYTLRMKMLFRGWPWHAYEKKTGLVYVIIICLLWCAAALYVLVPGLYLLGAVLFVAALLTLRWDLQRHQRYEPLTTRPHSNWCCAWTTVTQLGRGWTWHLIYYLVPATAGQVLCTRFSPPCS